MQKVNTRVPSLLKISYIRMNIYIYTHTRTYVICKHTKLYLSGLNLKKCRGAGVPFGGSRSWRTSQLNVAVTVVGSRQPSAQ